ncbi:hypothetical protein Trco_007901 [Trichoderma cornu-damae]|uniref:Zn(2)-C6 fungal-type domain-containing protein n=1 Tax=Trichoderma cornu-damae TaxID=654480 RepID=A0A9P8QJZ0_9HYPO|nr:hypothetical protein Trco_007901 [Trichoderma cornu-damae]
MPRRRASKACLHCRQRKVRCDVTLRGVPCLNCQLDHQLCAVQERKSKHLKGLSIGAFDVPQNGKAANEGTCMSLEGFSPRTASTISNLHDGGGRPREKSDVYNAFAVQSTVSIDDIGYSSHDSLPFIRTPELGHVSALDIRFMQLNRCFDLPPMPILNEFVRVYFLHVHPIVPLFNEGDFWDSFSCTSGEKISLLVFQAMIFAACAFIPGAIAEATGFDCPRSATAAFYKKAKILYDFEIESDPISLGQAACLFTFWPGALRPGPAKSNSAWLGTAIRHAKSLGAHHLTSKNAGRSKSNIPPQTRIALRRLWWCCCIRDRIIALAVRRTLQIPEKYPPLVMEDFEDEIHRSRVYNAESKRRFFDIFIQISKLCVVVTDLLRLCSISEDGLECEPNTADHHSATATCTSQMQEWYDAARQQFPDDAERPGIQPHFVIIQTNLMFTYYFAAKLALLHQEIYYAVRDSENTSGDGPCPTLAGKSGQVRDAVDNITKHLANPVRLGLAQYLPISVLVKQCHQRLDGIDAVCMMIRRLTDLVQARFMSGNVSQITECLDLIDYKPLEYLRLFLNLDLNLSDATMLDNIQFLELKEELLLRTKMAPSMCDSHNSHTSTPDDEPTPASTRPAESSTASKQQDAWDLNVPGAKPDALIEIDDSILDIDELLGGEGALGVDPSLIALESVPLMNQHMEWEMDAWLLGES